MCGRGRVGSGRVRVWDGADARDGVGRPEGSHEADDADGHVDGAQGDEGHGDDEEVEHAPAERPARERGRMCPSAGQGTASRPRSGDAVKKKSKALILLRCCVDIIIIIFIGDAAAPAVCEERAHPEGVGVDAELHGEDAREEGVDVLECLRPAAPPRLRDAAW